MSEKIIYQEKLKKKEFQVNKDFIPDFKKLFPSHNCDEMYFDETGIVEENGVRKPYHILRVYLTER